MATKTTVPALIQQKIAAFAQFQAEFEASFRFKQDVHGFMRFSAFPINYTVRYLHALWACEYKDRLLSIYKNIERYEGRVCLGLLHDWQNGDTASVVAFLNRTLAMLPLPDVTRQMQEARQQHGDDGLLERLANGRKVMLNRGMNLMQALDAMFSPPEEQLLQEVQVACMQYGHRPAQVEVQLAEMETPLYSYVPHQLLAQQNMVIMNKLGVDVMNKPFEQIGRRSWRVLKPTEPLPLGPCAEQVIEGYQELNLPLHNNLRERRFVDLPEQSGNTQV